MRMSTTTWQCNDSHWNEFTCSRTTGSLTPGVPATPDPSTTNNRWPSRAEKSEDTQDTLREEESEKCRKNDENRQKPSQIIVSLSMN